MSCRRCETWVGGQASVAHRPAACRPSLKVPVPAAAADGAGRDMYLFLSLPYLAKRQNFPRWWTSDCFLPAQPLQRPTAFCYFVTVTSITFICEPCNCNIATFVSDRIFYFLVLLPGHAPCSAATLDRHSALPACVAGKLFARLLSLRLPMR